MPRYFIEVAYNGAAYSGFQIQQNANSVQAEVEKALNTYYRRPFTLTGSSRTDAGVHAEQNFFHFDIDEQIEDASYNINAILPKDIVVKKIYEVESDMHCRFSAISREYKYYVYQNKNPFLEDRAYYFPFPLSFELLNQAAAEISKHTDFSSFSKRNTQTKTKLCVITQCQWSQEEDKLVFTVSANRFLRGMVRALVATILLVGRKKLTISQLNEIIATRDCTKADFSAPAHGLFLTKVNF